jgi:hypothetical protein
MMRVGWKASGELHPLLLPGKLVVALDRKLGGQNPRLNPSHYTDFAIMGPVLSGYPLYATVRRMVLLVKLITTQLVIFHTFNGTQTPSQCSQQLTNGPYPELQESRPNRPSYFCMIHFNIH